MSITIAIDCRMINASGIGVYLQGCLPWFIQTKNNFLLIGKYTQLQNFVSNENVIIIDCDVKCFSIKELLFFPSKIISRINKADGYYSPFFNIPQGIKVPIYTTIHDIIFPDMVNLFTKAGLVARMWFFRRAYSKSCKIFTVSEFSKSRIEYHLGSKKCIIVTYSAIRGKFIDRCKNIEHMSKKKYIIFIGNIKKHKGLDCLLEAFRLAKDKGLTHQLILIGAKDNFRSSDNSILQKIGSMGDSVLFTGHVSDEELMKYLSLAALLVQPSLYEGFCIPPLEAMVLGTKALISDIPVLREIYADFPVTFFNVGDSVDLEKKMLELLHDAPPTFITLSDELMSKYTFEKTALKIMDHLEGKPQEL